MKIGFKEFLINPPFPVNRMLSRNQHQTCADDLHCRILVIDDGEIPLYHVSVDTVEIYMDYRNLIKVLIEQYEGREVNLITSATHDHFCPCLTTDENYRKFLLEKIQENLEQLEEQEYETVEYSFQSRFFDKTGKSRNSGQQSRNVYAQTFSLYGDGKRLGTILLYNSHATTMRMQHGDFTSEYPGYCIRRLKEENPGEFFTFMLGPAGDISSRFTRQSQEYEEIARLGELLTQEYLEQLGQEVERKPLTELEYVEYDLPMKYQIPDISKYIVPDDLSEREKETIEQAREHDHFTEEDLRKQPATTTLCHLSLSGGFSFVIEPFEMFSDYYEYINKERCALVTISNGFGHYVSTLENKYLSMEVFGDIVSDDTKREIGKLFEAWSNGREYPPTEQ